MSTFCTDGFLVFLFNTKMPRSVTAYARIEMFLYVNLFTPLYYLRICILSFSLYGQNTLFCYAIGKKFRVLACLHHDFLFFSRTPTLSTSFHGPNTLFCNNISRNFLCSFMSSFSCLSTYFTDLTE